MFKYHAVYIRRLSVSQDITNILRQVSYTGTIALGRGSGAIDLDAILRAGPEPAVVPTRETATE